MIGQRPAPPTRPAPRSPLSLQTRNASTSAPPAPHLSIVTSADALSPKASINNEPRSPLSPATRPLPARPSSALSPLAQHPLFASRAAALSTDSQPSPASSTSSASAVTPSKRASQAVAELEQSHAASKAHDVKHVHKRVPFNPHIHTVPFSAFPDLSPNKPAHATAASLTSTATSPSHPMLSSPLSALLHPVPVLCSNRAVTADWQIHHDITLGSGFSSTVKLATSLHQHSAAASDKPLQAACKIIDKRTANVDLVKFADECRVLSEVAHGSIVEMYGSYEDDTHVYVLTEICQGGELFDVLCERGEKGMDEWEAAPLIAQLLEALTYLHGRGICHRDVKPENCLFLHPYHYANPSSSPSNTSSPTRTLPATSPTSPHSPPSFPTLKLTDFGFAANLLTKPRALRASSHLGSLGYTAPEIFSSSSYTESCDVWSVGAILHIMMTGLPPYTQLGDGERKQPFWLYVNEMHWGERQGQVEVGGKVWEGRSDEVQALVRGMLELDVGKRLRASEALQSSWVKEGRERWRRANAAAEQVAAGDAGGWSSQTVRERPASKASTQMTMREVMAEIVARAGQTNEESEMDGKVIGEEECKVNAEAEAATEGEDSERVSDATRPEKRSVAQRRLKALTMLDWRR